MYGAIAGAILQGVASAYGTRESGKAGNKVLESIQGEKKENRKWYEQEMAQDFMLRADAQNILRKQKELLNEQYQRARATNVVAGGTDESLALQQQAANQTLGETMANMAAQSEAHDEAVENQFRATEASLNQQERAVYQGQASQIAQAAGQMGKAVSGLVSGGLEKGTTPSLPQVAMSEENKEKLAKSNN